MAEAKNPGKIQGQGQPQDVFSWNGANIRGSGLTQSRTFLLDDISKCASSTAMHPVLASVSRDLLSATPTEQTQAGARGVKEANLEGRGTLRPGASQVIVAQSSSRIPSPSMVPGG